MKPKLLLGLAVALCNALWGCSTTRQSAVYAPKEELRQIKLPVRFASYRQLYEFMARREGVLSFPNAAFTLAADSDSEPYNFDDAPKHLWVITPHFYNAYKGGIFDMIRGATGNGNFYLVRPLAGNSASRNTDGSFELVGIAEGNVYQFSSVNQTAILTTHWHLSADKSPETVYEWDGKFFKQLKSDKPASNP